MYVLKNLLDPTWLPYNRTLKYYLYSDSLVFYLFIIIYCLKIFIGTWLLGDYKTKYSSTKDYYKKFFDFIWFIFEFISVFLSTFYLQLVSLYSHQSTWTKFQSTIFLEISKHKLLRNNFNVSRVQKLVCKQVAHTGDPSLFSTSHSPR